MVDTLRALLLTDDDERRAIERELHDGIQQELIALAVNLQISRRLVETDPQAAARLLDDMRADVAQALDDVRELAHRVHPPLLDTQGSSPRYEWPPLPHRSRRESREQLTVACRRR